MARSFRWDAADGTPLILTDPAAGYRVLDATTGLTSPGYRIVTEQYAGMDGVTVRSVTADAGDVTLAMLIQATDVDDLRARIRALVRALRPKVGPGTLTVADETGAARTLACYYTAGLEGDEARGVKLPGRWWKAALHFLAPDSWWEGDEQTLNAGLGAGAAFFPIFPLVLAPSSVQGAFEVDLSDSDDGAWPVWTIQGPGSSLVLTNQTTGASLSLDVTLGLGESMTVDTRPGAKSVRAGDGTNLMPDLTPGTDPNLWPLIAGLNRVSCTLTGATTDSRIIGLYRARYAGI